MQSSILLKYMYCTETLEVYTSRKEHAQHSINGWLHTQDAGEVAQGADASVGYGVHHCKALVSANCQPEQ